MTITVSKLPEDRTPWGVWLVDSDMFSPFSYIGDNGLVSKIKQKVGVLPRDIFLDLKKIVSKRPANKQQIKLKPVGFISLVFTTVHGTSQQIVGKLKDKGFPYQP